MHIVFYSTNDVFKAEELLISSGVQCEVVPTPVQDKAYCGVCIRTQEKKSIEIIQGIEFKVLWEEQNVI